MEFDNKYKVYRWNSWINLHWIINPGVLVSELLGRRIPKTYIVDETSDKPRVERSFVPCPHCGEKHRDVTWSKKNGTAYKNWFGLYCPNCGNTIPCQMNLTFFLILAVTFPIWGWFRKTLKAKWLAKQPSRYEDLDLNYTVKFLKDYNWIKSGLQWGAFMFVFMTFLFPYIDGGPITWEKILIDIPIWTIGGLCFGYWMKWFLSRKGKKQSSSAS